MSIFEVKNQQPGGGSICPDYLGQFPQDYLGQFHRNLHSNSKSQINSKSQYPIPKMFKVHSFEYRVSS